MGKVRALFLLTVFVLVTVSKVVVPRRDWNGSKRGHVYKFLRSQCFVASYDTAHHYTDSDADAHKVCTI